MRDPMGDGAGHDGACRPDLDGVALLVGTLEPGPPLIRPLAARTADGRVGAVDRNAALRAVDAAHHVEHSPAEELPH
jgi:hypothetical protein